MYTAKQALRALDNWQSQAKDRSVCIKHGSGRSVWAVKLVFNHFNITVTEHSLPADFGDEDITILPELIRLALVRFDDGQWTRNSESESCSTG